MKKVLRKILNIVLLILSKIYGLVVWLRNKFFDWNILKQQTFDIPVIAVGNIAVGGTGKTPHTEYIISLLSSRFNIGVISRGYKRKTKGFVLATNSSKPYDIGDEPFQMYRKFNNRIKLAVCENRCEGIKQLRNNYPDINLILLDDAFQHRYVHPDISIVMMEYNRKPYEDHLLPYGRLRESIDGLRRASMIIVSKCPENIKLLDFRLIKNNLNLYPSQGLYFSKYRYGNLVSVFPDYSQYVPYLYDFDTNDVILLITGIANPRPLHKYLRHYCSNVKSIRYIDHHEFERKDFDFIVEKYNSFKGRKKIIITPVILIH